jgi:hypothetical protein
MITAVVRPFTQPPEAVPTTPSIELVDFDQELIYRLEQLYQANPDPGELAYDLILARLRRAALAERQAELGGTILPSWATERAPTVDELPRPPIAPPSGGGVLPPVRPPQRTPSRRPSPGSRIPRPPRTPRPPRAPRPPRPPHDPVHRPVTALEHTNGLRQYCVVQKGKWKCWPPSCHVLPQSLVADWPEGEHSGIFVPTEECIGCGGTGCGTVLIGIVGCGALPGLIDPQYEAEQIRAAVARWDRRHRHRQVTISAAPDRPPVQEGQPLPPHSSGGLQTWCICATCAIYPPGPRSYPIGQDPNIFMGMPPGTWTKC